MSEIRIREDKNGWTFFQDDIDILSISTEEYFKFSVYEKEIFSFKEVNEIEEYVKYKVAKKSAYRTNIYNNKSKNQIYNKLILNDIPENIASKVVNDMEKSKEINEIDIIRKYINDSLKINPKSKKNIKFELSKKGFSAEDIEIVIEEVNFSDEEVAKTLMNKKQRQGKSMDYIFKFLLTKGFEISTVRKITNYHNYNSY